MLPANVKAFGVSPSHERIDPFSLSLIIRVFFCFFLSIEENLHRHFFWLIRTLLWLSAIFSLTVLVIAFPLAVDPAMESLWRRFSSKALICLTTDIQIHHSRMPDGSVKGDDACTWTSCRNGCTGKYLIQKLKFYF